MKRKRKRGKEETKGKEERGDKGWGGKKNKI